MEALSLLLLSVPVAHPDPPCFSCIAFLQNLSWRVFSRRILSLLFPGYLTFLTTVYSLLFLVCDFVVRLWFSRFIIVLIVFFVYFFFAAGEHKRRRQLTNAANRSWWSSISASHCTTGQPGVTKVACGLVVTHWMFNVDRRKGLGFAFNILHQCPTRVQHPKPFGLLVTGVCVVGAVGNHF